MSIIYDTLDRLEKEGFAVAATRQANDKAPAVTTPAKPGIDGGFVISLLLLAAVLLIMWRDMSAPTGPGPALPGASETQLEQIAAAKYKFPVAQPESPVSVDNGFFSPVVEELAMEDVAAAAVDLSAEEAIPAQIGDRSNPGPERIPDASSVVRLEEPLNPELAPAINGVSGGALLAAGSGAAESSPATAPALDRPRDFDRVAAVNRAIDSARWALARGQYEGALSVLEALDPVPYDRADFWFIKGSAHLGIGQLELAEKAFESAQNLLPGQARLSVQLAVVKQERGDHAGALRILEEASRRHPEVPEVFLNKGYSEQALGMSAEADKSFRIFLRMTENRAIYDQQREVVTQWLAQGPSLN